MKRIISLALLSVFLAIPVFSQTDDQYWTDLSSYWTDLNGSSAATGGGGIGSVVSANVATAEVQTAGAGYGNLATVGPSVTAITGTTATVWMHASVTGASEHAFISVAVSGATTIAAADANGDEVAITTLDAFGLDRVVEITGLTAGSNTFTLQYKNDGAASPADDVTFSNRSIAVDYGSGSGSTFVQLQASTPGTAQTGNSNISGSSLAGNFNKVTITAPATGSTLTLVDGSTFATSGAHSITLTSTADTTLTLPTSGTVTALGNTTTGSGSIVLATSPTLTTPTLGVATATSINKMAITAPATSSTLAVADGKTLTANNTMTLAAGADSQTFTFPSTSKTIMANDFSNASGTLSPTHGAFGADVSTIAKGGVVTGTGAGTFGITTVGSDGQVLTADAASSGGVKWAAGGGGISGLTTGTIPKAASSTTLADSIITESSSVVTIKGNGVTFRDGSNNTRSGVNSLAQFAVPNGEDMLYGSGTLTPSNKPNTSNNLLQWSGHFQSVQDCYVLSSQFDSVSSTLADTNLAPPVYAGGWFTFESELYVTADATGGYKVAMAGTATATSIVYEVVAINNATNAVTISSKQTSLGGSAGVSSGGTDVYIRIRGTIHVNAAGTLTVQFSQNSANGTSSVLPGASIRLQVGAAN